MLFILFYVFEFQILQFPNNKSIFNKCPNCLPACILLYLLTPANTSLSYGKQILGLDRRKPNVWRKKNIWYKCLRFIWDSGSCCLQFVGFLNRQATADTRFGSWGGGQLFGLSNLPQRLCTDFAVVLCVLCHLYLARCMTCVLGLLLL